MDDRAGLFGLLNVGYDVRVTTHRHSLGGFVCDALFVGCVSELHDDSCCGWFVDDLQGCLNDSGDVSKCGHVYRFVPDSVFGEGDRCSRFGYDNHRRLSQ